MLNSSNCNIQLEIIEGDRLSSEGSFLQESAAAMYRRILQLVYLIQGNCNNQDGSTDLLDL